MFIKAEENEINNRKEPLSFQNIAQPVNTDFEVRQIIQRLSFMQDMLNKGKLLHNKLHQELNFQNGKQNHH